MPTRGTEGSQQQLSSSLFVNGQHVALLSICFVYFSILVN